MRINNRRDAGYTIISRFEEAFRKLIENHLLLTYKEFYEGVPTGVILKANTRGNQQFWDDKGEFLENIDFPDLKEILFFKDHYKTLVGPQISREEFTSWFDELYALRCKIAHIKGYFTSIDLDKLLELSEKIGVILNSQELNELLLNIKIRPDTVIITIPQDFIVDFLQDNGVINNIPTPDYEYEGGFVGRETDRKKIIQYLKSEKFPVITITGAGGVGKTSLALRVIQEMTQKPAEKPFEAIIWLSAKENRLSVLGIEDIEPTLKNYEELLDTIISVYAFSDESSEVVIQKEELVQSIFDISSKVLIVIDNLETVTDERIINFIIDAPLNVKFLITSRKGLGQIEIRHELKQLKEREAIYLFRQLAKDKQLLSLLSLSDDVIKKYVEKVSFYPLAIKWVIGQIGRGKDINKIVESISDTESDISKFCFDQIFNSLSDNAKKILYAICSFDVNPTSSILQYVVEQDDELFDANIEELILVSLIIPEQFQNEKNEISREFSILPLTKGYIRKQLSKSPELREKISKRIIDVENTITITEKAKKEYQHSLFNLGAKTDEEKVAGILVQSAFQRYQTGKYDEAVEEYKRAIKMAPGFSAIYRNWGVMESYEGHLQEADRLMEKAESLNSSDPQIYLLWGNIQRKNGKNQEALVKYEKAYELAPNDHIILNALGNTKARLGDYEVAYELLLKAINTNDSINSTKHKIINFTGIAETLITWSDALIKDRNFNDADNKLEMAIKRCLEALNIDNRDTKIHATMARANTKRGFLYLKSGQLNLAIELFSRVSTTKPKSFKQAVHVVNSGLELARIYLYQNKIKACQLILKEISREYRSSPLFKGVEYSYLQSKYYDIEYKLDERNLSKGTITSVEPALKYLLITDEKSNTYVSYIEDFAPNIKDLDRNLIGKKVIFLPQKRENSQKRVAKYARFIV